MVENELVFNNANRNAKFYGNARLSLLNPASMFFEKYLFLLRYRFTPQKTPIHLTDLSPRMAYKVLNFLNFSLQGTFLPQFQNHLLCTINQRTRISQIRSYILFLAPPASANSVKQLVDLPTQLLRLTPSSNLELSSRLARISYQTAHRVP